MIYCDTTSPPERGDLILLSRRLYDRVGVFAGETLGIIRYYPLYRVTQWINAKPKYGSKRPYRGWVYSSKTNVIRLHPDYLKREVYIEYTEALNLLKELKLM